MKKSVVVVSRLRMLLLGLAIGASVAGATGLFAGCSLGPKQDDPIDPSTSDTGFGGSADTSPVSNPDAGADGAGFDAIAADSYDPTADGCRQADADGGDAERDGEVGCDAGPDASDGDAPGDGEGGSDATGG